MHLESRMMLDDNNTVAMPTVDTVYPGSVRHLDYLGLNH